MFIPSLILAAMAPGGVSASGRVHQFAEYHARQVVRRLQGEGAIPNACWQVCPAAEPLEAEISSEMMKVMQANPGAMPSEGQDMDLKAMGPMLTDMALSSYTLTCKHKAAYTCMLANPTECADAGGNMDQAGQVIASFDCMCVDCPCLQNALAEMTGMMTVRLMQALQSIGSDGNANADPQAEEKMAQETMEAFCAMTPGYACIERESSCADFHSQSSSSDSLIDVGSMMNQDQSSSEMAAGCAQLGHSVDVTTCTLKIQGTTDGAHSTRAALPLIGLLAVFTAARST